MDPGYAEYVAAYRRRWAEAEEQAAARALGLHEAARALAERCRQHGARRVVLFGSVARGQTGEGGDLDIAVEGVPDREFFALYGELLHESPVMVDLVAWEDASASLRASIEREGVVL